GSDLRCLRGSNLRSSDQSLGLGARRFISNRSLSCALLLELRSSQSGLVTRRIRIDLLSRLIDVLLEFLDSLAHRARDLGNALRSEKKQNDHHDDQDLGKAEVAEHIPSS